MRSQCRPAFAILASLLALTMPMATQAQEVSLTSPDGQFAAKGQLLSLENGFYTLKTFMGTMRINASTVDCSGAACPQTAQAEPAQQNTTTPPAKTPSSPAATTPPPPQATPAEQTAPAVDVRFAGSDTVGLKLMPLLLDGYGATRNAKNEEFGPIDTRVIKLTADEGYGDKIGVFQVISKTSSAAFPALLNKSAEFGMASRRIKRDEARALAQDGAGSMIALEQEHIVAMDSLVVIVNPDNPIQAISMKDLASIYAGRIKNWSELGGPDMPITAYTRADGSGTRAVFESKIFGSTSPQLVAEAEKSNETMASRITAEPGAIGYVGYAFVNTAKPVSLISSCGIESAVTAFSAKTEEYPLERRLYLYTRQDNTTETGQAFLNYALSNNADGVIQKAGYISLSIERIAQDLTRSRAKAKMDNMSNGSELNLAREMVIGMYDWDRLSSTFHFSAGSNTLERKSSLDLDRLIAYLQDQPAGTKVALVGFTDSDGPFSTNKKLSERRAKQVLAEIQSRANGTLDHITFETHGYGELNPSACNSSQIGKHKNRRVEVWTQ